jgi:hypothetical protein
MSAGHVTRMEPTGPPKMQRDYKLSVALTSYSPGMADCAVVIYLLAAENFTQARPGRLKMPHYLLTGAGFSRNWGGWLANEAFEYLLGAPEIDDFLRHVLWDAKLRGEGFEGALSTIQGAYAFDRSAEAKLRLDRLTQAVIGMFNVMQSAFNELDYRESDLRLQHFLSQFDAIFTLNQDTLLETLYAGPVRWSERWHGSYLPYMKFIREPEQQYTFMLREPPRVCRRPFGLS